MNTTIAFDNDNHATLSKEEVLSFIDNERKVTIVLRNGFVADSDTEDVFRGLMGSIAFEENIDMMDALEGVSGIKHTFFLSNDKEETPFNERGMAKRLIKDNYWTSIILDDYPLKNGFRALIMNKNATTHKNNQ